METIITKDNIEVIDKINVGSYTFKIVDKSSLHEGRTYCRRFTIKSEFAEHDSIECVEVVVSHRDSQPVYAEINLSHDNSVDTHIDGGKFSVILRNALFHYVREKIPSISEIRVEDTTSFASAHDIAVSKKGSDHFFGPVAFYYFSIAFNGKTWYEHHFGARLRNPEKHEAYRKKVDWFLYSKELKSSVDYTTFIRIDITSFLQMNYDTVLKSENTFELIDELEAYYNDPSAVTFADFFQLIPKQDRCRLVGRCMFRVMRHFFGDAFSNSDWVIDIPAVTNVVKTNEELYYCPEGRFWDAPWFPGLGVRPEDL
jgi:hypothetical protein